MMLTSLYFMMLAKISFRKTSLCSIWDKNTEHSYTTMLTAILAGCEKWRFCFQLSGMRTRTNKMTLNILRMITKLENSGHSMVKIYMALTKTDSLNQLIKEWGWARNIINWLNIFQDYNNNNSNKLNGNPQASRKLYCTAMKAEESEKMINTTSF